MDRILTDAETVFPTQSTSAGTLANLWDALRACLYCSRTERWATSLSASRRLLPAWKSSSKTGSVLAAAPGLAQPCRTSWRHACSKLAHCDFLSSVQPLSGEGRPSSPHTALVEAICSHSSQFFTSKPLNSGLFRLQAARL